MTYAQRDGAVLDQNQLQRQQHQKQRQQQQQQLQQHSYGAPGRALPEKQHQSKHNPVSKAAQNGSQHSCDH